MHFILESPLMYTEHPLHVYSNMFDCNVLVCVPAGILQQNYDLYGNTTRALTDMNIQP